MAKALIVAAPCSGSGKTVLTLGLLRALRQHGVRVASAKVGPDYIDPQFHAAASGRPCFNLDPWAMRRDQILSLLEDLTRDAELIVIEGVMGLFDGPEIGRGSTADLAEDFGIPTMLVVDCSHQAQSIAALVSGFIHHRPSVKITGILLNRVASDKHEALLRRAIAPLGVPVIAAIRRDEKLALPSRHLGLVQAREHAALDGFIDYAASKMDASLHFLSMAGLDPATHGPSCPRKDVMVSVDDRVESGHGEGRDFLTFAFPSSHAIAVAADDAFAFAYPHVLHNWQQRGIKLRRFSPLADEAPDRDCDAIFLPGGYPELYAAKLSSSANFLGGLREAASRGIGIYGECGGYMVLGDYLIDAAGMRHAMAGLLPVGTSFAKRKLHLGYRSLDGHGRWRGHEFHYSTIDWQGEGEPLFHAKDAAGRDLGCYGLRCGNVMGSYAHIIA